MERWQKRWQKRPLTQKQDQAIRFHLDREGRLRDKALFDLASGSKLRGCDLVKIKIGDLVAGGDIRTQAIVIQQKTNRPIQFELTVDVRATIPSWLERRGGSTSDYLFPSRVDPTGHMSTRQYARLIDEWVTAIGLRKAEYGTHSLRRTKAAMLYRATGNIRAIQILLTGQNLTWKRRPVPIGTDRPPSDLDLSGGVRQPARQFRQSRRR